MFLIEVGGIAMDRRRKTTSVPSGKDINRMCVSGGSLVFGDRRLGEFKLMT